MKANALEAVYQCGCVLTAGDNCRIGAGELLHNGGFEKEVERRAGATKADMLWSLDNDISMVIAENVRVWLRRILTGAE